MICSGRLNRLNIFCSLIVEKQFITLIRKKRVKNLSALNITDKEVLLYSLERLFS